MIYKYMVFITTLILLALFHAGEARATFSDTDPDEPGRQTASWPEPTQIMVFIPPALTGDDRMNFEMGINTLLACLSKITVQFKDGDPPDSAENFVDVNITDLTTPPFAVTTMSTFTLDGQNHGKIESGKIDIDPDALGNAIFMKNIGAHEFGHALGLDDDPRQGGLRTNMMDANFKPSDPFLGPSERDKKMLREHYMVVPEPSSFILMSLGTAGLLCRGLLRRKRSR